MRIFFLFLASCLAAGAADVHVRPGATGANNGTDWNNAYTSLPPTLVRGNTYYLADGSYGLYIASTPVNGTTRIIIKKATESEHGSAAGWSNTYGNGQAAFTRFQFRTSDWTIDGSTGGGPGSWQTGFGITVQNKDNCIHAVGYQCHNITLRHLDMSAFGDDGGGDGYPPNDIIFCWPYPQPPNTNWVMEYLYLHDATAMFDLKGLNDSTIQYCYSARNESVPAEHSIGVWFQGVNNVVRHCVWEDIEGTGVIMLWGDGFDIYNNVIFNSGTPGSGDGGTGNGAIGGWSHDHTFTRNARVYNNTIVRGGGFNNGIAFHSPNVSGNVARNNLFVGNKSVYFLGVQTLDNNTVDNNTSRFMNWAANDFRLNSPLPGASISAAYRADLLGVSRGADGGWDRGAYEFSATPQAVPRITGPSVAIAAKGRNFSYQIDASEAPTLFSATGLPAGLSINPTTGLISGTPSSSTTNKVILSAGNSVGTATAFLLLVTMDVSGGVPPALNPLADMILNEDAEPQSVSLSGIGSGSTVPNGPLIITAASSNPNLLPAPQVSYTSPGSTGMLLLAPRANRFGTATVTVTVNEGQFNTVVRSFLLSVESLNDLPTITDIPAQTTREDQAVMDIPFTIGDVETSADALTLTAFSSDPNLLPPSHITFSGGGAQRLLAFLPAPGRSGVATVTVEVRDEDGAAASRSFPVSVTAAFNNRPTLNPLGNLILWEDSGTIVMNLAGIGPGSATENQTLTVTAASSTPALIPLPTLIYTSPNSTGSLTFTPAPNASGVAILTVTVTDGQSQNNRIARSFLVQVNPLNDTPTITDIPSQTSRENQAVASVPFSVDDQETSADKLLLAVSSSNPTLIPVSNIILSGTGSQRTLSWTSEPHQIGLATITVEVWDEDGGATSDSFEVSVTTVINRPPSLEPIPDQRTGPERTVADIILALGDLETEADELAVTITSSNPALVPVENLVLSGAGEIRILAVTPADGQTGTSTITVHVSDADDGVAVQSFLFTVSTENSAPLVIGAPSALGKIAVPLLLRAIVRDDGLPDELTTSWRQISGPGTIIFSNISAPETTVTAFQPGTYFLRFTAKDGAITVSVTNIIQIGLAIPLRTPRISDVFVELVRGDKVELRWLTDLPAESQIEFGLTSAYGSTTVAENKLVTSHKVELKDLRAETAYHFRIRLRDTSGYWKASGDYVFTVPNTSDQPVALAAPGATTPPVVTSVVPGERGRAAVRGLGTPNVTVVLQARVDSASWAPIATATTDAAGLVQVEDPVFGWFPNRVYRFVEL